MEPRGNADMAPNSRPAIARRSCDQCRARKVGCDRGSPCSNCRSARVDCTHSTVASRPTSKRRVLISAEYERKIDQIASDIEGIKSIIQPRQRLGKSEELTHDLTPQATQDQINEPQVGRPLVLPSISLPRWDHSAHIIDFVKAVVEGQPSSHIGSESSRVIVSLRNIVKTLEGSNIAYGSLISKDTVAKQQISPPMPSMESVVGILRWAKAHTKHTRIAWICNILPLDKFEDISRKVYFAVDDYTEVEFIIANSFLSYVFAEHAVTSGSEKSRSNCQLSRSNLGSSLSRLPLLLPASMEVIAALTLGSLYSIEDSKATSAWAFISAALSHCLTLGYHQHLGTATERESPLQFAEKRLFWTVYSFESGLSLRLGRSSGIHDADIMLPIDPAGPRSVKVARIQKKVYNQLYSTASQSFSAEERSHSVHVLSKELKTLIEEGRVEISEAVSQLGNLEMDTMKVVYLHCDLVCESSLLVLILRAMPTAECLGVSEECVATARNTLDMHQHCMELVRGCRDPSLVTKYITWAVLHTPFVPFSILFTRAVQLSDNKDLARLDTFGSSLKIQPDGTESLTHPFRLYELLCQAARLYVGSNSISSRPEASLALPNSSADISFEHEDIVRETDIDLGTFDEHDRSLSGFGDWYYSNQQLMGLLDEDVIF